MSSISTKRTTVVTDDVLFGKILPLLPFRSLCRFKLVSKAWKNTISGDRSFALEQSRRPSSISTGVICNNGGRGFPILSPSGSRILLDPRTNSMCRREGLRILACTNGLICCVGSASYISVINPATGDREKISHGYQSRIPISPHSVALAFDPVASPDRYTLVNLRRRGSDRRIPFDVFSSVSGEWVSSTHDMKFRPQLRPLKSVYAGGVVYWDCYFSLLWFDVGKGVAGCSDLPVEFLSEGKHQLGVWGDRLTCTRCSNLGVEVWVMSGEPPVWRNHHKVSWETVVGGNREVFDGLFDSAAPTSRFTAAELIAEKLKLCPLPFEGGEVYLKLIVQDKQRLQNEVRLLSYNLRASKVEWFQPHCGLDADEFYAPVYGYHNSMVDVPKLFNGTVGQFL